MEDPKRYDHMINSGTMAIELKSIKETNTRLMQIIGFLVTVGFGAISWYVKGVSDKIEKFIITNNTLKIHQSLTDKSLDKLERRIQLLENSRYQGK